MTQFLSKEARLIRYISCLFILLLLAGCISAPEMRKDKELASLLEAYVKENARLEEEKKNREKQIIKKLEVVKAESGDDLLVSVNLKDAPLDVVIHRLLDETNLPYLLDNVKLEDKVTARFEKLPLKKAMDLLLRPSGLSCVIKDSVLIIQEGETAQPPVPSPDSSDASSSRKSSKSSKSSDTSSSSESSDAPGTPVKKVQVEVPMKHISTDAAVKLLDGLFHAAGDNGGRFVNFGDNPANNTIFLYGSEENVKGAVRMLKKADRSLAHVVIESLVIEFDSDAMEKLGVDIFNYAYKRYRKLDTNFGSLLENAITFDYKSTSESNRIRQFSAAIDLLISQDKAQVISRPYISTLAGKTAKINITRDRYVLIQTSDKGASVVTTQPISAGIILKITPTVLPDQRIRMDVEIEESQFIPTIENIATEVDKNSASTTMLLESGQAIIIGGLVLNRQTASNAGAPWLRHVPGLNLLFSNRQSETTRQEVMIYMRPRIWKPEMSVPLVEKDSFTIKEKKNVFDDFTDFEKLGIQQPE